MPPTLARMTNRIPPMTPPAMAPVFAELREAEATCGAMEADADNELVSSTLTEGLIGAGRVLRVEEGAGVVNVAGFVDECEW